jgi:hypothetical protein
MSGFSKGKEEVQGFAKSAIEEARLKIFWQETAE